MTATGSSYSRRTTALTVGAAVVLFGTCVYGTWGRSIDAEREAEAFFRDCMDPTAASRCQEFTEPAEHATLVRLRDEYAAACGRPSSTSARVVKTRGSVYSLSGGWFSKRHVVEGLVVSERCGTTFELEFATNAGMNLHVIAVRHDSRRLAGEAIPAAPFLSDAEQSASPNDLALGKLRPYLDCTGDPRRGPARGPATSTIAYLRALPLPTSDPAAISRVPALGGFIDARACIDELAAVSDPDDPELEALGRAWSEALAELAPLVAEVSHYYDHEDYLDDGWAKGRLLHPKLVAAASAFRPVDDALRAAIRVRYRAWRERELLRLDAIADRTLGWHERRTFLLAARIMDYGDVDILPTGVLDLDVGRFGPALTNLENELMLLAAYVAEHPDALESTVHAGHLEDFQRECDGFKKATKRMLRRKRDNRRFSPAERDDLELGGREAAGVEGGVPELEAAFRDVAFAARRADIPG